MESRSRMVPIGLISRLHLEFSKSKKKKRFSTSQMTEILEETPSKEAFHLWVLNKWTSMSWMLAMITMGTASNLRRGSAKNKKSRIKWRAHRRASSKPTRRSLISTEIWRCRIRNSNFQILRLQVKDRSLRFRRVYWKTNISTFSPSQAVEPWASSARYPWKLSRKKDSSVTKINWITSRVHRSEEKYRLIQTRIMKLRQTSKTTPMYPKSWSKMTISLTSPPTNSMRRSSTSVMSMMTHPLVYSNTRLSTITRKHWLATHRNIKKSNSNRWKCSWTSAIPRSFIILLDATLMLLTGNSW